MQLVVIVVISLLAVKISSLDDYQMRLQNLKPNIACSPIVFLRGHSQRTSEHKGQGVL